MAYSLNLNKGNEIRFNMGHIIVLESSYFELDSTTLLSLQFRSSRGRKLILLHSLSKRTLENCTVHSRHGSCAIYVPENKRLKPGFKYKIIVWIFVLVLLIHKGYFVVKKIVWNVGIKDFLYTNKHKWWTPDVKWWIKTVV